MPDSGGTYFLPRLVGTARAMGLAMLAEPLSAEDAERWGLIWKVFDDAQLMTEASALARKLAAGPTKGYGLIKKALTLRRTTRSMRSSTWSATCSARPASRRITAKGVAAFLKKRKPIQGK